MMVVVVVVRAGRWQQSIHQTYLTPPLRIHVKPREVISLYDPASTQTRTPLPRTWKLTGDKYLAAEQVQLE